MNKSILLIALNVMLFTTGISATERDNNMETKQDNSWEKISPNEVKNAVTLFDKDWMALAAGKQGAMNAMTISWGEMGELWNKPVITVFVRKSRYTKQFMDSNDYFTVSAFPKEYRKALSYIGSHSGRDGDKLAKAGLTPEFTALGNPMFREANLVIECKKLYSEPIKPENMDSSVKGIYDDGDIHTLYIGEIINVWVKK
jgi:flavin reductase (DIM6/NTAB) family NADH-FMN oxidoreductase RutF